MHSNIRAILKGNWENWAMPGMVTPDELIIHEPISLLQINFTKK